MFKIDCATQDENVGLARAVWDGQRARITDIESGGNRGRPVDRVTAWARNTLASEGVVLLALDAPLGWPRALGEELGGHFAGKPLSAAPDRMFRRQTDDYVWDTLRKRSLDVGADRIARTAHAALALLGEIAAQLKAPLGLVWSPGLAPGVHAIEVYPAATLKQLGAPSSAYKKTEQRPVRDKMLDRLREELDVPGDTTLALDNANVLDAIVCVLAASDFLAGRAGASALEHQDIARQEGWIWVRQGPPPRHITAETRAPRH